MNRNEFYAEIETIVDRDSGSIKGPERLADLEAWDSLAVLSFIALADAKFGASLTAESLISCQTVDDLAGLFPGKIS